MAMYGECTEPIMRESKISNVSDVVRWRLCVGCGACVYLCPERNISLVNMENDGIRPKIEESRCKKCGDCLKACPGIEAIHESTDTLAQSCGELREGWGTVLELWEGYASDPELRFDGSSGGAASALALYCLEKENMHGALHISADGKEPFTNRTVLSKNRDEILSRAGSRYAPASPCDGLGMIEAAAGPCVFIGKPCDVTALWQAQRLKPALDINIGIRIGIFCAGTPSTQGTLDLLYSLGIDPSRVEGLRYRGRGWPGKFSIKIKGEEQAREVLTYMDAWGFVQKYRPYRCYLCPDGTSEFADISCGDPWYRQLEEREQGYSLVLVRTEKGKQILRGAIQAGYISVDPVRPHILEDSQKNLLTKRGAIWGRLLVMKACGVPSPRFVGFALFHNWMKLSFKDRIRSIVGTVLRIIVRRYFRPAESCK